MKINKIFSKIFNNYSGLTELIPDLIGMITVGSDSAFDEFFKKLFSLSKQHKPVIKELMYSGITSLNEFINEKEEERGNPLILSIKRINNKLVLFIFDIKNENGKEIIDKKPAYVITDEQIVTNVLNIHESSNCVQEFLKKLPEALNSNLK